MVRPVNRSTPCQTKDHNKKSRRDGVTPADLARIRDWIERDIEFVPHPLFEKSNSTIELEALRPTTLDQPEPPAKKEPGIAFVSGMVEMPLLSGEEERYLFLRMNFFRHKAEQARRRLSLNQPDIRLVEVIEADLCEATWVRNRIVQGNLRLVVAVARKLSISLDQMSELIGEGTIPLIRAVELFNVSLGNRFSTYATWAVRNQMIRSLKRQRNRIDAGANEFQLCLSQLEDPVTPHEQEAKTDTTVLQSLHHAMETLTEREREIIAARFGINGEPGDQSLATIALRIGLSKERVRQIAIQALEKLRAGMAAPGDGH